MEKITPWSFLIPGAGTELLSFPKVDSNESSYSSFFFCVIFPIEHMGVNPKIMGGPQIIHIRRVFHYKPSILGYHYFWKHPYMFFHVFFITLLQCQCVSLSSFPDASIRNIDSPKPPATSWRFFVCFMTTKVVAVATNHSRT